MRQDLCIVVNNPSLSHRHPGAGNAAAATATAAAEGGAQQSGWRGNIALQFVAGSSRIPFLFFCVVRLAVSLQTHTHTHTQLGTWRTCLPALVGDYMAQRPVATASDPESSNSETESESRGSVRIYIYIYIYTFVQDRKGRQAAQAGCNSEVRLAWQPARHSVSWSWFSKYTRQVSRHELVNRATTASYVWNMNS